MLRRLMIMAAATLGVLAAGPAHAQDADELVDQWLPSSDQADWVYGWVNSAYSPAQRREHFTVQARSGELFRLRWEELDPPADQTAEEGFVDYRRSDAGLINVNYQSTPPPPSYPILCASVTDCGNSLAGTTFLLIWGTRSPVLAEPLQTGTRWSSLGGQSSDVTSDNRYVGREVVKVPAFPDGVLAAKVQSQVTQAGALGDPFGSGVRTVWWVRGVGPVRIAFRHASGETSQSDLLSTSLTPLPPPSDANLFPLVRGTKALFRWRNSKHMRRWSTQRFTATQVVNNTIRVDVKAVKGPIKLTGTYAFASRLSGLTNLSGLTQSATRVKFPRLGPRSAPPADRRRLLTPYDFLTFGLNPVLTAEPTTGDSWRSSPRGRDFAIYGVNASSRVLKPRKLRTRFGRIDVVGVRTSLSKAGFPYGSGTRTSWFAPDKGLVKLVFRHDDGSVSTVERLP